tara:strand:- start:728 stop:1399 length:672 start_codon:yes stop_codon:yes gene_type:complete
LKNQKNKIMGQNSTEVAYSFGQFGSAYSDVAKPIVPPTGLVITAITFLAQNTPTVLTSEKLDSEGPSYINIQDTSGDIQVASNLANFNGVVARDVSDGTIAAGSNVTIASASDKIKVGQYVLLVAQTDSDTTGLTIDTADTPIPITRGPNKQGVRVASYGGGTTLTLDGDISPSSQGLVFLDDFHGAGGLTASGQVFPAGVTIYGRWTAFTPSAAGVVVYFGK